MNIRSLDQINKDLNNSIFDYVYIKMFGAKGDGITDDTLAIQSAIDYLESLDRGGIIFFPRGDYLIKGTLVTKGHSIYWLGEAPSTEYGALANKSPSRIVWGNTVDSITTYMLEIGQTAVDSALTRRVTMENLTLDGNGYVSGIKSTWAPEMILRAVTITDVHYGHYCATHDGGSGIKGRNYANSWESCYFYNFKTIAVRIDDDGHRSKFDRCHFASSLSYIPDACIRIGDINYSSNVTIIGCNFEPFGDDGTKVIHWIDARRVRALNVIGCYFEIPAGSTIRSAIRLGVDDVCLGANISGNRFIIPLDAPDYASVKRPIWLEKAKGVFVGGNFYQNYNGDCVFINGLPADIVKVRSVGNYSDTSTSYVTAGFDATDL